MALKGFIRKKKQGDRTYYYLVKSVRVAGKVKHVLLAYLGVHPTVEECYQYWLKQDNRRDPYMSAFRRGASEEKLAGISCDLHNELRGKTWEEHKLHARLMVEKLERFRSLEDAKIEPEFLFTVERDGKKVRVGSKVALVRSRYYVEPDEDDESRTSLALIHPPGTSLALIEPDEVEVEDDDALPYRIDTRPAKIKQRHDDIVIEAPAKTARAKKPKKRVIIS